METEKEALYLSGCCLGHSVVPECEVIVEGVGDLETKFSDCEKNPGHKNFIPVEKLTAEHLPENMRTKEMMDMIRDRINRTVLVRVKYTSLNRPNTFYDSKAPYPYCKIKGSPKAVRYGTASIVSRVASLPVVFGDCPCPDCKNSENPYNRYWKFHVSTATHVIFDDSEAERAVFKCFYDSEEDQEGVVSLYGVKIDGKLPYRDMYRCDVCEHVLCVTHDEASAKTIMNRINLMFHNTPPVVSGIPKEIIVSHPHGCSKRVSIGSMLYMTIPLKSEHGTGCMPTRPEFFLLFATYHSPSQHAHGEKFPLPEETTIALPPNAEYIIVMYQNNAIKFPAGTTFTSPDGSTVPIPDDAEFESIGLPYSRHYSVVYNIPTCPGSSGAFVSCYWMNKFYSIPHCGWDPVGNFNCSGVQDKELSYNYFKEFLEDCVGENEDKGC